MAEDAMTADDICREIDEILVREGSEAFFGYKTEEARVIRDHLRIGKEAIDLLQQIMDAGLLADERKWQNVYALLGTPNSVGWVWAREIKEERDMDAEMQRTRDLALGSILRAEEAAQNQELELREILDLMGTGWRDFIEDPLDALRHTLVNTESKTAEVFKAECLRMIIEMTEKHANPNGTEYQQGAQDHGHRLHAQVQKMDTRQGKKD